MYYMMTKRMSPVFKLPEIFTPKNEIPQLFHNPGHFYSFMSTQHKMKECRSGYAVSLFSLQCIMGMSLHLRVAFPAVFPKPFEWIAQPFEGLHENLLTAAELFELHKFTSLLTFAEVF